MSWANTTLSTTGSIKKWENEILDLTNTGENATFINDDIDTVSAELEVLPFSEMLIKATSELNLDTCVIKLQDSADGTTWADYATLYSHTGTIADATTLSTFAFPSDIKNYAKIVITGTNTGSINAYVIGKWIDKIALAKDILGADIEIRLLQDGKSVDYAEGEVLLDIIANPTIYGLCSDFKILELIYTDLSHGDEDSVYWRKAEIYLTKYTNELVKANQRVNFDNDLDGTTDEYNQELDLTPEFIR